MNINLIMARELLPASPSVFLAGPTSDKSAPVPSWRPDAVRALAEQWTGDRPLTVLSPESRHGLRADRYETQVDWETEARAAATAILFWIPRDLHTMPGMTTNVEFPIELAVEAVQEGCGQDELACVLGSQGDDHQQEQGTRAAPCRRPCPGSRCQPAHPGEPRMNRPGFDGDHQDPEVIPLRYRRPQPPDA
ncbi:nucleoside 2-deoxyribosyltransferase domain-containing protein [Streptomyces sp. NPDC087538]|uniref:nucleoside 2-deoxyribosyltransferase domain-containing protein n=1 Tax=Streptomyces sp. NPDC087538 TaxID=3365797 RepID=UPI003828A132